MRLEVILFVMVLGGLIPSRIVAKKGYEWGTMWLAGTLFLPAALLYALALPDKPALCSARERDSLNDRKTHR